MADPHVIEETKATIGLRKSPALARVLRELKIFVGRNGNLDIRAAHIVMRKDAAIAPYAYWENSGILHTMGALSYSMCHAHEIAVGSFCSIARDLSVMGQHHPLERGTTSPVTYDRVKPHFIAAFEDFGLSAGLRQWPLPSIERPLPVIGHDVWVGQQVTLARGISIGTGAVLAAGAVVTRDVAPYAVMGGNPARVIKYRFDEAMIARLLASTWWEYGPAVLALDMRDPAGFLDRFEAARALGTIVPAPVVAAGYRTVLARLAALDTAG